MSKRLFALALALVLTLGVAGFGASAETAPVTLTMIESLGNPVRTASMRAILDDFEAANPDIKVELLSPPLEGADQKIAQMLMAQNDLDIVETRSWTIRQFIDNGWIQCLDDYYADYAAYETYTEGVKQGMLLDGKKWNIPIGSYQRMIYYRVDWLEELGLTIPEGDEWTFEALHDLAVAMTDPAKGRYGWAIRGSGNSYQQYVQMVAMANLGLDKLLDPTEPYFTKDGKSIYRTPEAKAAVEAQIAMYKDASPADSVAWGFTDQTAAFSSGICGLLMQDSDCVGIFESAMEEGTWATTYMPVGAETKQGMLGYGGPDGWGMTSHTRYPEQTWRLLSYLGTSEINARFCRDYGVLPIHTNASEFEPTFGEGVYEPFIYMFSNPEKYFSMGDTFQPYTSFHSEFGKISDQDLQNLLLGQADLDETLAKWADLWEAAREELGYLS